MVRLKIVRIFKHGARVTYRGLQWGPLEYVCECFCFFCFCLFFFFLSHLSSEYHETYIRRQCERVTSLHHSYNTLPICEWKTNSTNISMMDLFQEKCIEPNSFFNKLFRAHIVVINSNKTLPIITNAKSFNRWSRASQPSANFLLPRHVTKLQNFHLTIISSVFWAQGEFVKLACQCLCQAG